MMKGRLAEALFAMLLALALVGESASAAARGKIDLGQPLSVEDCVRIALARNNSIAIAHHAVRISEGAAKAAWSQLLPDVSASAYWDRLVQGPTERLTLNERTGEIIARQTQSQAFVSYTMSLTARQSLFSWSAVSDLARARADVSAARYAREAAEKDIAYQVRTQFYSLVKAEKLLEVARKSLERSRAQLEKAQSLFELGSVARSDVLKAKVDVAQSELDLIAARNAVELERARLAKIMGLRLDRELAVRADLTVEDIEIDAQKMFEAARKRRPDLLEARERLRAARAGLEAAKGGRYPNLFGFFNYRWRDDEFPDAFADFDSRYTWDVGMGVSYPLFDGMRTKGNIGQARAALMTRERELRDLELQVLLDIKEALLALEEARQRIRVSEEQLASAEESYKLAQEQYDVGLGTILELTDARVQLTSAESQKVEAITAYKTALALLDRASGADVRY